MTDFFKQLLEEFSLPLHNPVLVFSVILFIILFAPIVLKRLRIPGIIGLIISGVLIGPYGFNILENNSAIELFSTIGLLYIMFIAGLELDINSFKTNRYKSMLFGFFTFTIPIAIGYPISYYILGYDENASLLISSLFATHTLVAYPIVSKMGVSKNEAVTITLGGTIITDTAVLIFLAIIINKHNGLLTQDFFVRMVFSLLLFLVIVFYLLPRIARWFFKKLESEGNTQYIFVLSLLFFVAFLAEVAGLEPIIGAFVAGLALNKLIPHNSVLMNRIEFVGNALFIPFFLISVGMLVDIRVVLKGPATIYIATVLTIGAILSKWLAAFFTQILLKYSHSQRQIIFGLSSSHAAAILAVILIGYKAQIVNESVLNATIIIILITCIVASFVTERAAKKVRLCEDGRLRQKDLKKLIEAEHIMISVANYGSIPKLLEFALLIKDQESHHPISLLSVVQNDENAEINLLKSKRSLEDFVLQGSPLNIKINPISTIDYSPANGISRISREVLADTIIIGWSPKANFIDKLLGEKVFSIINKVDKNLFICQLNLPLITLRRTVVLAPEFTEMEFGFLNWVKKVFRIVNELKIPVVFYGSKRTIDEILRLKTAFKAPIDITYKEFSQWNDFLILSRKIRTDDLIIFIAGKKGSITYKSDLEAIPSKLERYFSQNDKIIIYPQQSDKNLMSYAYKDFSAQTISKSIETLENFGKGIGNIFKKDKNS